jgi:hypothetical protein
MPGPVKVKNWGSVIKPSITNIYLHPYYKLSNAIEELGYK